MSSHRGSFSAQVVFGFSSSNSATARRWRLLDRRCALRSVKNASVLSTSLGTAPSTGASTARRARRWRSCAAPGGAGDGPRRRGGTALARGTPPPLAIQHPGSSCRAVAAEIATPPRRKRAPPAPACCTCRGLGGCHRRVSWRRTYRSDALERHGNRTTLDDVAASRR